MKNDHRIPEICPDWDVGSTSLTSVEGFLLSRIDGKTTYGVLCEIGGMEVEEVRSCLDKWYAAGWIRFVGEPRAEANTTQGAPTHSKSPPLSKDILAEIDPSLDISEAVQRSVLEFQSDRLGGSVFKILGLPEKTDANAVKRAYFSLSRQFHPDRYFGKRIGAYEGRLELIFQTISDAYKELTRSLPKMAMAKSIAVSDSVEPTPEEVARAEQAARIEAQKRERARVARRKARHEAMERARKRRPFNPYRTRAETLLEEAERQLEMKAWKDADGTLRLAKSFVGGDRTLKRRMKELRRTLDERRRA